MTDDGTVFIVDDNEAFRDSLISFVESVGLAAEAHPNAQSFLEAFDPDGPACVLLDIRMPGMSGLELQAELVTRGNRTPVIIVSAHGNVEKAVRAMKNGAFDFVKKPYEADALLECIHRALKSDGERLAKVSARKEASERFSLLTPREYEVMKLLIAGKAPKEIAFRFGLSRKTVDVHRGHVMTKLRVYSVVGLVRAAEAAGEGDVGDVGLRSA